MNIDIILIIIGGIIIGYLLRWIQAKFSSRSIENKSKQLLNQAKSEIETQKRESLLEIKEQKQKEKEKFENETKIRKKELEDLERRLIQREESLDRKVEIIESKESEIRQKSTFLSQKEKNLNEKEKEIQGKIQQQKLMVERIAQMSSEEAKKVLINQLVDEAKRESAITTKKILEDAQQSASKEAKMIIAQAIQKCASDYTSENTVSTVFLPNAEMKGRIIGKEGRNIKTFEALTGVDVIIDDTPDAITLSSFDGVRREIAKICLEKLIQDGRIQPARIEEVFKIVSRDIENHIKEIGENIVFNLGLNNFHPELIKLIGRLAYRTSYGQNVLKHSEEVAYIGSVLAAELNLDIKFCKRAGILHDIGKGVDANIEGNHASIGAELAKKYGESEKMVNAIAAHHEDVEPLSVEAILVQSADAISASRPGVRKESLENYLKRLENLEKIALSFKGIAKAYAIQAGREIRVIVEPDSVDDKMLVYLAKEIVKKIENEAEYPGQIKVTVIREKRASEIAS